jgi:radical SAM superfamily enzyme YgiQ (UPF0313 family)
MNIIFLNSIIIKEIPMRPYGPYLLRHQLEKRGYTAQVVDFCYYFSEEEIISFVSKFVTDDTICLGVSTTFLAAKNLQEKICNVVAVIKNKYPDLKVLLGGPNAHRVTNDVPSAEYVCIGDCEDLLPDLMDHWTKGTEEPFGQYDIVTKRKFYKTPVNKMFNIEESDFKWSIRDCIVPVEPLPLETSRGCIFKCKFCAYPLLGKKKLDYLRSVELLRVELINNYEKFGVTSYSMLDDTFNDSEFKIDSFCEMVKTLPFKINFAAYIRMDLLARFEGQAEKLRDAGLRAAFFGIETFHQEASNAIGKGWHGKNAKTYLNKLLNEIWKEDVYITVSFIAGLPYEDRSSVETTLEYLKNEKRINPLVWPLQLHKTIDQWQYHSEFEKNIDQYGYTINDDGSWSNDLWTSAEATEVSKNWFKSNHRGNGWDYSCWDYIGLMGLGYTHQQIAEAKINKSVLGNFAERKLKFLMSYKEKLINLDVDNNVELV